MNESLTSRDSIVLVEPVERRRPENTDLRARIDALCRERETALAEAWHRSANCLQLLSSLIRLRQKQANSPESRAHLSWLQNLVFALGLLQRHLTTAAGGTAFSIYLAEQSCLWRPLCAERGIDIAIDADNVEIANSKAVPLALIVNELLTNSLEHAFPADQGGRIEIELKLSEDGLGEVVVADNGVGLPANLDRSQSLGLQLVERLTAQIEGRFSIGKDGGTVARIRFPPT